MSPTAALRVLHNPFSPDDAPPSAAKPADGETLLINYSTRRDATRDMFAAVKRLNAEGFAFRVQSLGHVFPDLVPPPNVTVSRFLPHAEYLDLVARARAFLCTCYGTAFSVSVMEAITRRTPVLCPWDIGVLDLLPPGCVLDYESHSADAMTDALRAFFRMTETERTAMAQRARTAVEVYDEALITRKLETIYDALF